MIIWEFGKIGVWEYQKYWVIPETSGFPEIPGNTRNSGFTRNIGYYPILRVTRYQMIFKTESGRVSNEIPGIGSGSGTRWTLPTRPNLPNQIYQSKPTKPNLPNQTNQTKPTKPYIPNQTYQIKPNLPNHAKPTKPSQTYKTIPTKPNLPEIIITIAIPPPNEACTKGGGGPPV